MKKPNFTDIRKVITLGLPLMAGLFAEYIMYLADSSMVGRLGTKYLAAMAVGGLIAEILWNFCWTISPGTQSIAARRYGKAQAAQKNSPEYYDAIERTGVVIDHVLIFSILTGIVSFFLASFSRFFLEFIIEDPEIINLAVSYISIIKWSMLPISIYFGIYGFLAGLNIIKPVMYSTIGTNALNFLLNYILIFGKFGFPALGIRGAAIGTAIAQVAGLVYTTIVLLTHPRLKEYKIFRFKRIRFSTIRDIALYSLPVAFQHSTNQVLLLIYEGLIERFGASYVAVVHILFLMAWSGKSIVGGIAQGASILVGNAMGRGERETAVRYVWASIWFAFMVALVIAAIFLFMPELVIRLFNSDADTLRVGTGALRMNMPFFFVLFMAFTFEVVFSHNGLGRFVFLSEALSSAVFLLGYAVLMVFVFNVGGRAVLLGFGLYLAGHAFVMTLGYRSGKWLETKVD
jgi:putative MATE family efflux protein